MSSWISIARIVKIRGITGEVAAEILTDFPERFAELSRVSVNCHGKRCWEELENFWFHKDRVIFKFTGRNRPEEVRDLIGCELQIPEERRVNLPQDSFYDSDLIGCRILEGGRLLGTVTELFETGRFGKNLVVVDSESRQFMIPMALEFILSVDLHCREIDVALPPGLRELAQPEKPKRKRPAGGQKKGDR